MEQQQNWTQLLELLERPAFTVEQGRVSWANREALARLVSTGIRKNTAVKTATQAENTISSLPMEPTFWERKPRVGAARMFTP